MTKKLLAVFVLLAAMLASLSPASADSGPERDGDDKDDDKEETRCEEHEVESMEELLECVTIEGVREHQAAFQAAADRNNGIRVAGSPGYDESALYVARQLRKAEYDVTLQEFDFPFFEERVDAILEQVSPDPVTYAYFDVDGFATMTYSGSGDVTAATQGVDLALADPASSTSGCEPEDFAGFVAGNIAITQRGACSFAQKATNAEAAGAVGVVVFNQGNGDDRLGAFVGTLGGPGATVPVVGAAFDVGVALAGDGVTARMFVDATSEIRTTFNVLAESTDGEAETDRVVMVGAHLDSVSEGPGIQDNGSGSAAILEVALQLAETDTQKKIRFAWWSAEESGLLGSEFYVANLPIEEQAKIDQYLNFDMIGSPNYVFSIYDGDDSDAEGAGPGPEGSAEIETVFEDFYNSRGLPFQGTDFSGRSDYGPFIDVGIAAGGLFTGAEGIKTAEEAAIYGGVAGEQYDQCYHLACDTFDNVSLFALETNSDSVAYATLTFAGLEDDDDHDDDDDDDDDDHDDDDDDDDDDD